MTDTPRPEGLNIPGLDQLEKLRAEADSVIDTATAVLDHAAELQRIVDEFPVLPASVRENIDKVLQLAQTVDRDLKIAKAFLDHVPV